MAGDERQDRRGNVMVIGLMFGVLLGFSALSVDIGLIRLADTELQQALDSATLSGVNELDGKPTGVYKAITRTKAVADMNLMLDKSMSLPLGKIEVGIYNKANGQWTAYDGTNANFVNAVRVDYTPPAISSALGQVAFGVAGYNINARAMAVRPRGTAKTSDCFLPFAVPKCLVDQANVGGVNPKPLWFTMNSDTTDSVAFAQFDGNANASGVSDAIENGCEDGGDLITVGDPVYAINGVLGGVFNKVESFLNNPPAGLDLAGTWDVAKLGPKPLRVGRAIADATQLGGANVPKESIFANLGRSSVDWWNYGHTLEGPITVVTGGESETGLCEDIKFNANTPFEVDSITWGILFDVRNSNSNQQERNMVLQVDAVNKHETKGDVIEGDFSGNVLAYGEPYQVNW